MTVLLDANVLVALVQQDHVHHDPVRRWFLALDELFATCPTTQGALLRFLVRMGAEISDATGSLQRVTRSERHEFWPDDLGFLAVRTRGVVGHRQVTDAYLAQQARARRGTIASLDRGLVALHADVAVRVPSGGG